ncbi:hypothetical protein ACW9PK_13005 [Kocuria sp. MNB10]
MLFFVVILATAWIDNFLIRLIAAFALSLAFSAVLNRILNGKFPGSRSETRTPDTK